MNNLSIHIDTINGTGSLSANQLLTRIIFRAGVPVGSYNFFPSNIAGLPCSYALRLNDQGFISYEPEADILISLSPKTLHKSIKNLKSKSLLVTDEKNKTDIDCKNPHFNLPISKLVNEIESVPIKIKPFLKNMVYVGLITEWLNIKEDVCVQNLKDSFAKSQEILNWNLEIFKKARSLAKQNPLPSHLKSIKLQTQKNLHNNSVLMDGNTSMALGALFSGCQFVSWYPITPATSLAESFEKFANQYQINKDQKKRFMVLQSEDEISALNQVIGAGWAGLRAMATTSGPGLSLMAEAAGLSYFSEVPAVLCNIQRAGPSTGLPTRTQQSDLLSSCFLSHGDSRHIVLIPGNLKECFSFMSQAFDLAEQLQTLVIVLSDLNLGMNLQTSSIFEYKKQNFKRGKLLDEKNLPKDFARYKDIDKDGVSYRSLPGTNLGDAAYFTRGSGHNEKAEYSEDPKDYSEKLNKLKRKWDFSKSLMPEPIVEDSKKTSLAFITFGNNDEAIKEALYRLEKEGTSSNFMRIRSFPFHKNIKDFLEKHSEIFVVEQNRDGQLKQLLSMEFPNESHKLKSITQYDGLPFYSKNIEQQFKGLR